MSDEKGSQVSGKKSEGVRLEFLDAIRGVAAFIVLIQHYSEQLFRSTAVAVSPWLNLGRAGVVAFFIVSGFVIPMSIERRGDLRAFWISRVFRLYPAYLASMVIFLVGYFVLRDAYNTSGMLGDKPLPVDWRTWLVNFSLLQFFFQGKIPGISFDAHDINPVAWTLGFEWMIYIGCAALFAVKRLNNMWFVAGLSFVVGFLPAIYRPFKAQAGGPYVGPMLLWFAVIGLVIFRVMHGQMSKKAGVGWGSALLGLIALTVFINRGLRPPGEGIDFPSTWMNELTSALIAGALFVVGILWKSRPMPKVLVWLGQISYSLYLLHAQAMLLPVLVPGLKQVPALCFVLQVVIAVGLSALFYRFIEQPGIAMGKKFMKRKKEATPA